MCLLTTNINVDMILKSTIFSQSAQLITSNNWQAQLQQKL